MSDEFDHLFPAVRPIAALGAEERVRRIRADRWIDYPLAREALAKLEELIAFPPRARMPNLLIVGASGMGKTMIVEKFARDHPGYYDAANGLKRIPVVVVQMVSGPDEARFYKRLLAAIGAPEPLRPTLGLLESVALRLLGETKPGMLVIDEVHSLQAGTVREQARFLNMLRFLGNELRIPLVCVGTQAARNALRADDQLVRRFEAFALPPWRHDDDFAGLIGSLMRSLPLRRESVFGDLARQRVVEATGGVTALFGPSGAGKTTLVNTIAGLIAPDRGSIALDDTVLFDAAAGIDVPPHRRRIGYVFQEGRLFPHLSVRQNLDYGRRMSRHPRDSAAFARIAQLLDIGPLLDRRPRTLSGGERQRVAIGRALLIRPRLLLLDEPLASLDAARKHEILPYLVRLRDEAHVPMVYVSHTAAELRQIATNVVRLDAGRVVASGGIELLD